LKIIKNFNELKLNKKIIDNLLNKMRYEIMTPIQRYVVPFVIEKKDVMGCSETGSGKTIAFLGPIISKMLDEGPPSSDKDLPQGISAPVALIIIPTRELAEQIYKEARKLIHNTGINVVKVYGGVPYESQLKEIKFGCDILVATPGRLIDFIEKGLITLSSVQYFIIDEADRILDMGFEDQLKEIVYNRDMKEKSKRQNMMFSATFSPEIRNIAKGFMNDYYFVTNNRDTSANENIEQTFIYTDESEKIYKLHEILQQIKGSVISNKL
jgi:ATP-dependent RNA helicase DDX3X